MLFNVRILTTRTNRLLISSSIESYCKRMSTMSLSDEFKKHQIVPDVIPVAPSTLVDVRFKSGVALDTVGRVLTPTQVKDTPHISFEGADPKSLHTLIMTDPDAPSRKDPKYREWHHWLVVNIPGDDVDRGEVLSEYIGSGPPPGTGLHRYVFLVYKQSGRISEMPPYGRLTNRSGDNRGGWSAKKYADKHKLGDPIAGNFFEAEYDDYVPILYKQLGA